MLTPQINRESKILLSGNFSLDKINIIFNPFSNRIIDKDLELRVEKSWLQRKAVAESKNIKVWNAETYRLNEFCVQDGELYLELSTIDFKTRAGMKSIDEIYDLGSEYYGKGIFTAGLIKTTDNKFVFGELSGTTLSSENRSIDFIGGVLSKDEIEVSTSIDLARALCNEIKEEINIDEKFINEISLKAIVLTSGYNVGLIFDVELDISSDVVLELFKQKSDGEMKAIRIIEKQNLAEFLNSSQGYISTLVELVNPVV